MAVTEDGRSPSNDGSGCEPTASAAISVASSQSRIPNAVRIAVVQSLNGYLTAVGPNDFKEEDHGDQLNAAIAFHLEAGELPAAYYWITAELPPVPTIPELRAQAERGQFPKSLIADMDSDV